MLTGVCRQEKEEVRRLKEIAEREEQKTLCQHNRLVEQHMDSGRFFPRRVHTSEKHFAAVEERPRAVYALCSSLHQKVGEHPIRLRKGVRGEVRTVEIEFAQVIDDQFEDPAKDLIQCLTSRDEL